MSFKQRQFYSTKKELKFYQECLIWRMNQTREYLTYITIYRRKFVCIIQNFFSYFNTFLKNKANLQTTKMHHLRTEAKHETVNIRWKLRYFMHIAKDALRFPSLLSDITYLKKE